MEKACRHTLPDGRGGDYLGCSYSTYHERVQDLDLIYSLDGFHLVGTSMRSRKTPGREKSLSGACSGRITCCGGLTWRGLTTNILSDLCSGTPDYNGRL